MASTTTVAASVSTSDGTKVTIYEAVSSAISTLAENGKRETVTLTGATFNALTVPTGAKGLLILIQGKAGPMTLKGVTGDTGIVILTASAPGVPILIPLGTTPVIGILNSGSTVTVELIWF